MKQNQFYIDLIKKELDPIAIYGQDRKTVYSDFDYIVIVKDNKIPHFRAWAGMDILIRTFDNFAKESFANYRNEWTLLYGQDIWENKQYNNNKKVILPLFFFANIRDDNYKRIAFYCKYLFNKLQHRIYEGYGITLETPEWLQFNYNALTKENVVYIYNKLVNYWQDTIKSIKEG
jgi:hypothetical protein